MSKQTISTEALFDGIERAWIAARGENSLPRRADIDALKLRALVQHVCLIDVVTGPPIDFRYRLLGQRLVEGFGYNITGRLHSEFASRVREPWPLHDAYQRCIQARQPQTVEHQFRNHNQTLVRMHARVWPLSDDGRDISGLLGAGMFLTPEPSI